MKWIFLVACFFGTIAAAIFVKSMELNGLLTAAIIAPLMLLTIYSLANVQPASSDVESKADEGSDVLQAAEVSE